MAAAVFYRYDCVIDAGHLCPGHHHVVAERFGILKHGTRMKRIILIFTDLEKGRCVESTSHGERAERV